MTLWRWLLVAFLTQVGLLFGALADRSTGAEKLFRAGAAAVDISPKKLPAIVSGGFLQGRGDKINDPLFARCLVLDDGATRLAIVVVDSLMMPRELLDDAKRQAQQATGIRADHILVSAIHTHSAPSAMGALGTGVDEDYTPRLPGWIAQSVAAALANLAPARVGWGVIADYEDTHCRRWIYRPDRMRTDPFGQKSVRAMMHPGYQNPDCVGPAGPVDPGLTVLAVASPQGRPIALLANYSMHYFGAGPISADYFGRFCRKMTGRLGAEKADPPFVAMMSQGTAGDLHWMDYGEPRKSISIDTYSDRVAAAAFEVYRNIQVRDWAPLAMAEDRLTLRRRVPDEKRLAWARAIIDSMKGRTLAASQREVYALEQVFLHKRAATRTALAGNSGRRPGHHGDPRRGVWAHRAEDQGAEPLGTNVQRRAGQRGRGLYPHRPNSTRWAAIPHGRPAPLPSRSRPNLRSSRRFSNCWSELPANRVAKWSSPAGRIRRPCSRRNPLHTGDWANLPVARPRTRSGKAVPRCMKMEWPSISKGPQAPDSVPRGKQPGPPILRAERRKDRWPSSARPARWKPGSGMECP